MINETQAKKYCSEDISLIENYELAIADKTQTWECHHRLECVNGVYTSPATLIEKCLYNGRPANELIFLTKAEHWKIHGKDPAYRKKISKANKGENNGMHGKHHSEEAKIKMSEAHKGCHFWNNGIICKYCKESPGPDFVRGRLRIKSL